LNSRFTFLPKPAPKGEITRRIKRVVLTEAGTLLYGKVLAEAAAFRKELLVDLDPNKLLVATELLESLQGAIDTIP